jgi:hypothetical protein
MGLVCGDVGVEGDSYANLDILAQQCSSVACAWPRLESLETLGMGNSLDLLDIVVLFDGTAFRVWISRSPI